MVRESHRLTVISLNKSPLTGGDPDAFPFSPRRPDILQSPTELTWANSSLTMSAAADKHGAFMIKAVLLGPNSKNLEPLCSSVCYLEHPVSRSPALGSSRALPRDWFQGLKCPVVSLVGLALAKSPCEARGGISWPGQTARECECASVLPATVIITREQRISEEVRWGSHFW